VNEIRLQSKQEEFLSSDADICIGGGAAGGGKSFALTIEPLRHVNVQGFNSVMFRRTYPEIMHTGGVWDEAMGIYPYLGGIPKQQKVMFEFPRAKLGFGYILNDAALMKWKSAQINLVMFDQLETFTEQMFFYMLSRNRSSSGVQSYVRATANPEPNWLANLLSYWIADDGYANMDRAGKTRAFIRVGGEIIWADTKQELLEQYPGEIPKTLTFVPFTIYDNPILLEKDPGYLASLRALPFVDRERLLGDRVRGGNWFIKPSAGKVFNEQWFQTISPGMLPRGGIECRYFDTAASLKKYSSDDPDFTAGVSARFVNGKVYITDSISRRISPAEFGSFITAIARNDQARCSASGTRYMLRWEQEPGSASIRESYALVSSLHGIDAMGVTKHEDKLSAWKPLAAQALQGNVILVEGGWNKAWLTHMHGVPDLPHDDTADASAGAYNELVKNMGLRATSRPGS